ncbi:MAG: Adenylosuccinate synthetase, partial [uncultured Sphingomonadaceae bacterium]
DQRHRDRRAMGRRGQGQDRRLAQLARRRGCQVSGRPQCGPHARHRRRGLQAVLAPLRHRAGPAVANRQRRGVRPLALPRGGGAAARAGRGRHPRDPPGRRHLPADPALPPRARRAARGGERPRGQDRHHAPRHRSSLRGQGRPPRAPRRRPGAARRDRRAARPAASPPQRAARRLRPHWDRPAPAQGRAGGGRAVRAALRRARVAHPGRGAAGGASHPVRRRAGRAARRRPRDLPVCHLLQRGGGAGRRGVRPRPGRHRLRARHRQGLRDPRRLRPVPDRAARRDRPAIGRARARIRHRHRPQAPLRLVRRGARPPGHRRVGRARRGADQARRARRLRRAADLHRLLARWRSSRLPAKRSAHAGRGRAGVRALRGLERVHLRRAQLGRPAGAGGEVHPTDRGADRLPGGDSVHQPRARRHDLGARPVRV